MLKIWKVRMALDGRDGQSNGRYSFILREGYADVKGKQSKEL